MLPEFCRSPDQTHFSASESNMRQTLMKWSGDQDQPPLLQHTTGGMKTCDFRLLHSLFIMAMFPKNKNVQKKKLCGLLNCSRNLELVALEQKKLVFLFTSLIFFRLVQLDRESAHPHLPLPHPAAAAAAAKS